MYSNSLFKARENSVCLTYIDTWVYGWTLSLLNLFFFLFWTVIAFIGKIDCLIGRSGRDGHVRDYFCREVWWRMHINLCSDRTHVYHSLPSDSPLTPCAYQCDISQWLITSLLSPSRACSSLSPKTPLRQVHHSSQNCLCPDCWKAAVTSALLLLAKSEKASLPVWPWQLLFFCGQQYNCSSTFYWLSISFFLLLPLCLREVTAHDTNYTDSRQLMCLSWLSALATC